MDEKAFAEWRRRRQSGDETATLLNLYDMVARPRGLEAHELPTEERISISARAVPVMWPGFEFLPESERPLELIELVPYDPEWPERFNRWKDRLISVLQPPARRIDHVGSTAVPGLAAKPHVDIQVSVGDVRDEALYVPAIESLGAQLRNRDDEHRYFRPFAGQPREIHIHVCDAGGLWERRHLLFVAYLRQSSTARDEYLRVKITAAARWADDRVAYTEAKDEVIRELTARAEDWATRTGWIP